MKYLFLDIDGVLNHRAFNRRFQNEHGHVMCVVPDNVAAFNTIVDSVDPAVVISSSWRTAVKSRLEDNRTLPDWLHVNRQCGRLAKPAG